MLRYVNATFEIMALMNPVQLKESSVRDAIDTPDRESQVFHRQFNKHEILQETCICIRLSTYLYLLPQVPVRAKETEESGAPKQTVKLQH